MYRHMLVPLDHSELAPMLTAHAVALARAVGARITFLTVCDDYGATGEGALQRTLSPERFGALAMGEAEALLGRAAVAARAAGVAADVQLLIGEHPYERIVKVADDSACDVVVMASHGRRGLERLVIGSQTQKVLDHARTPVLVVPVRGACEAGGAQ